MTMDDESGVKNEDQVEAIDGDEENTDESAVETSDQVDAESDSDVEGESDYVVL